MAQDNIFLPHNFCTKQAKMAGSLELPENRYHVRSISMPSRSHPLALRVDEEMNKLKAWERSSGSSLTKETICIGLGHIRYLYDCIEDLLHLPLTQQSLINHHHEKCVDEISTGLVRLMDMCGTTRDILMLMKEHTRTLQFALRRRGQESSLETKVNEYIHSRKKVKKDINKCLSELRRMENKCASFSLISTDQHLVMVVVALREVGAITIAVLRAVLSFMSASRPNQKPSKWSLVSKLVRKGLVACEGEEDMNEIESVDVALTGLCTRIANKDAQMEKAQMANKRLEALEIGIEDVEAGLECMFRRLIQTKVSLLNILTH